jgi:hypothetical protein
VANASGKTRPAGDAGWRRNFAIDVMGTVHAVEAARSFLEASSAAAVIVIASGAALETFYDVFPAGGLQPYAALARPGPGVVRSRHRPPSARPLASPPRARWLTAMAHLASDARQTSPRQTLLGKSRRSIANAMGVRGASGMFAISLPFKRSMQDRRSARL